MAEAAAVLPPPAGSSSSAALAVIRTRLLDGVSVMRGPVAIKVLFLTFTYCCTCSWNFPEEGKAHHFLE